MNKQLGLLLTLVACPAFADIDFSILDTPATSSGGSFVVSARSQGADETIGAYEVGFEFTNPTAGAPLPITKLTVTNLMPSMDINTSFGSASTLSQVTADTGTQSNVAAGDDVIVSAFNTDTISSTMETNLFRVDYEFGSAFDMGQFNIDVLSAVTRIGFFVFGGGADGQPAGVNRLLGPDMLNPDVPPSLLVTAPTAVPEPSSFALLGLVGIGILTKRYFGAKKKNAADAA